MVDDGNVLLGRITIDDVVDIIREQAEHRALGAAGLDGGRGPVLAGAARDQAPPVRLASTSPPRSRLVGGGPVQTTIAHIVALAVLMPIVAGMGGNATQVLRLWCAGWRWGSGASNVQVLIWKEVRVAALNGLVLGQDCWA